jgi:hypothetical protein
VAARVDLLLDEDAAGDSRGEQEELLHSDLPGWITWA